MIKVFSFLIIFVFLIVSCSVQEKPRSAGFISPHHEFLDPLIRELAGELKSDYGIEIAGLGGATTIDHKLKEVSISFRAYGRIHKNELRELLIDITQRLIKKVNAEERLKQHLNTIPFGIESITLGIVIDSKNGSELFEPDICIASNHWGFISYTTLEKDTTYGFEKVGEETYEEALEIIQREQQ